MQAIIAVIIFLVTYAVIITEKINRAVIALAGAALMVLFGIVDLHKAFTEHIEWNTITLLIGMMILVNITNKTGVFQFAAVKAAKLVKGEPVRILIILAVLTGIGSAFLDNVTTVLLIVPVTFSITRILDVKPFPFLISEVLFSNIGGTATLIGDPPNIMIGSANPHLTFNTFFLNLAPIIVVIGAATIVLLYFIYRKHLHVTPERKESLLEIDESEYIKDRKLMYKSLGVLVLTIIFFALHSFIPSLDAAAVAISGATLLLLIGVKENQIDEILASVEWVTIFFFAGLFTLVGGLVETGIIKDLASQALNLTGGNITIASLLILWVSGIASGTIDNIPYVATMIPLIQNMADGLGYSPHSSHINALWWSLSLGACLGGNMTLIGASANVIVSGLAEREGHKFSYMDFLKIGAPLTAVALIISTVYIYLRYLLPLS